MQGNRLFLDLFSYNKVGQVYDQNVQGGFPVLSALLQKAGQLREAEQLPSDWVDVVGRCEAWFDATHPAAWKMIQDFDLQDCYEGSGENCDEEAGLAVETMRIDDDDFSNFQFRPVRPGLSAARGEGEARRQGGV